MPKLEKNYKVVYATTHGKTTITKKFPRTEKGVKDGLDFLRDIEFNGGTGTAFGGILTADNTHQYWRTTLGFGENEHLSYEALADKLLRTLRKTRLLKRAWMRRGAELNEERKEKNNYQQDFLSAQTKLKDIKFDITALEAENEQLTYAAKEAVDKYEETAAQLLAMEAQYELLKEQYGIP